MFTFIDLFAGIGGFHQAAKELGGQCVFASEIDKHACKTYAINHGLQPCGDITKIDAKDIPDHDMLFAGFPCQSFSIAGKRLGFEDTRGTLFFEIARILKEKQPKMFLLENVKGLKSHDNGKTLATILETLKSLGYEVHWKVLNAKDYGVPQNRERIFFIGFKEPRAFEWPTPQEKVTLSQVLEGEFEREIGYTVRAGGRGSNIGDKHNWDTYITHTNKSGTKTPHNYSCALRANASHNYLLVNGLRRLTPRECARLQGFPDSFIIPVSNSQAYKQFGNAVCVKVVREILKQFRMD